MKFPRNAKIFRGQLDAAPFAALFFVLVIFLLLNSSLVTISGIKIQLPEAPDMAGTANQRVVVAVDLSGRLYYEYQVISEAALLVRLKAVVRRAQGPVTLIVLADKSVSVQTDGGGFDLVRLSQLARAAGIREVSLATRPKVFPLPPAARSSR
ncbi:MAG: ExbD/TolR family protein [Limisphaerales bacterium]